MTDREKLLSNEQKDDLKGLLEDLSGQIKSKEEVAGIDVSVDEKLLKMSQKIDTLLTEKEAKDFLDDVKEELAVLREYQNFKELLGKLERKVDEIEKQYTSKIKDEIAQFKQQEGLPNLNNLTPEQMVKLADKGREGARKEIEKVVKKIPQGGILGKLAKLATESKGFFS